MMGPVRDLVRTIASTAVSSQERFHHHRELDGLPLRHQLRAILEHSARRHVDACLNGVSRQRGLIEEMGDRGSQHQQRPITGWEHGEIVSSPEFGLHGFRVPLEMSVWCRHARLTVVRSPGEGFRRRHCHCRTVAAHSQCPYSDERWNRPVPGRSAIGYQDPLSIVHSAPNMARIEDDRAAAVCQAENADSARRLGAADVIDDRAGDVVDAEGRPVTVRAEPSVGLAQGSLGVGTGRGGSVIDGRGTGSGLIDGRGSGDGDGDGDGGGGGGGGGAGVFDGSGDGVGDGRGRRFESRAPPVFVPPVESDTTPAGTGVRGEVTAGPRPVEGLGAVVATTGPVAVTAAIPAAIVAAVTPWAATVKPCPAIC